MLRFLNKLEESIIAILFVSMAILVFIEVVMRFVFSSGFMWIQEFTLLISAWFVLFGASYGLKMGAHIGMDAFVGLFPSAGRRILTSIAAILSLIYCGLLFYGSWIYLSKIYRIGIELEDLPWPTWMAHSILLVGVTLLTIRLLQLLFAVITGKTDSFKRADEAKESLEIAEELRGEKL